MSYHGQVLIRYKVIGKIGFNKDNLYFSLYDRAFIQIYMLCQRQRNDI